MTRALKPAASPADRQCLADRVLAEALVAARELDLTEAGELLVSFLEASTGQGRRGPLPPQR